MNRKILHKPPDDEIKCDCGKRAVPVGIDDSTYSETRGTLIVRRFKCQTGHTTKQCYLVASTR